MKKSLFGIAAILSLFVVALALDPVVLRASDHADPLALAEPESNITDLFFYPKGDQMILILDVRRALTAPKPYDLSPFDYVVHMDLTNALRFDKDDERARYGGTVVNPEKLHSDVTITLKLNDDTTLKGKPKIQGLKGPEDSIRVYTGVRDDPFIFPRFFKKNTIAMVMSIPMTAFPDGQRDWILWGSTYKDGKQIDHVGRSNRTQQARFDSLNTLPPNEHVAEIMRLAGKWDGVRTFLGGFKEWQPRAIAGMLQFVLQIRKYDMVPDVMIYTNRFPVGFPNGRLLTDDVGALTCQAGDCILQELSLIEGGWPRQTVNDKTFLEEWPYLAEPWPEQPEPPAPTKSIWPYIIGILVVVAFVSWGTIEIIRRSIVWLWRRSRRQSAMLGT